MGNSFIFFGPPQSGRLSEHGFWSHDRHIQKLANEFASVLALRSDAPDWLRVFQKEFSIQASIDGGCVCLPLDEFLSREEQRAEFCAILREIQGKHPAANPVFRTADLLIELLEGRMTTTAASPTTYMVPR